MMLDIARKMEAKVADQALISQCSDCGGSGRWFDMPEGKRNVGYGEMGPSECTTCDGWGLVPCDAGLPFFEMVLAMRQSPKWR